jgi:hypothetical protein
MRTVGSRLTDYDEGSEVWALLYERWLRREWASCVF